MVDLKTLDVETLYKIYVKCLSNEWPFEVGEKPEGFDCLPNEKRIYQVAIRRTKQDYLHPIGTAARSLIPNDYINAREAEELDKYKKTRYSESSGAEKIKLLCYERMICLSKSEKKAIKEYCSKYP